MKRKIDVKFWAYLVTLCLIAALVVIMQNYARNVYHIVVWFGFAYFCIFPFCDWISRKVAKKFQSVSDDK